MSEEPTEKLGTNGSFEARVLRELAALNGRLDTIGGRLTSLEEKVDARLRETRPIWEAVLSRIEVVDSKLDIWARDLLETRAETEIIKRRVPPAA